MIYKVSYTQFDDEGEDIGGMVDVRFDDVDEPEKNIEFLVAVADAAKIQTPDPRDVQIASRTPEPGEPGYRDNNTIDMFSEATQ